MIIWSGRGILSIAILLISFLILNFIIPFEFRQYIFTLSFFITGAFSWYFGKKWNTNGKIMIDKASGQEVLLKPNHSLFWIKMQYWGIVFAVLGCLTLILTFI
ncbi:hypothetical protein SAMN04489761_1942 [Tenacibaculum sp. MAR_2009_124]|nr:hypothetical protein SAMN04489761_1942 [Tenacibaculum sp. MAR_2009_124]